MYKYSKLTREYFLFLILYFGREKDQFHWPYRHKNRRMKWVYHSLLSSWSEGKQTSWFFIFPAARLNMEREKKRILLSFFLSLLSVPASTTTRRTFASKCWQRHRTQLMHSNDRQQGKEQAHHNNAALRPPNVRIISSSESNPVRLWCVIIVCEFFQAAWLKFRFRFD